ncbi:MAG: GTP 3',8-cyclase MoaA [Tsuneonella sp.]
MLDRTNPATKGSELLDGLGRRFEYLRLSITEVCNFRCIYCLPHGYSRRGARPEELSAAEIGRAVRAFAALGLWKVRLTGGEPTVRADFDAIARVVAEVPGIRRVAMTTNGWRLAENARAWRDAGIDAINISIDTLDPVRFAEVTGHNRLASVIAGIDAALAAGFSSVKLNAVLMRGVNDDELDAMLAFVAKRDVTLRFIEVMRTNDNPEFFAERHMPGHSITRRLEDSGWRPLARTAGAGPAIEYAHGDFIGRIGVIAPYSHGFCDTCNRLRLSAEGRLHLCLFGDGGLDLRPLLQRDDQADELVERIIALTATKSPSHRLHQGNSGATPHLASIGG